MRILHTADWHVGKKLGRVDRTKEYEKALQEVVEIAEDQKVDLAVVAGDLFDRATPPLESLGLVVQTLIHLAEKAGTVVAICGNHDSPQLFGFLEPLLRDRNVILVPRLRRPGDGGVITVVGRDGKEAASVAAFPFLRETEVVEDFLIAEEEWKKAYAEKVRAISQALCGAIDSKTIGILAGHFFVENAELGGGERKIHIGPQYATTPHAIPGNIHYAALGHVHRPQVIPGAPVSARYAGSLLQLDFSEHTHIKEVVIVDAQLGRPAKLQSVAITEGRRLLRVEGEFEELKARAGEFGDAYLDVRVRTGGPVMGLAEMVREHLPNALLVQAVYEREDAVPGPLEAGDRSVVDSYADFHRSEHGAPAPQALLDLVRELEEETADEAA